MIRRIKGRRRRVISSALIAKTKGRRIWFRSHVVEHIVLRTHIEKMLKGKEKENLKRQIKQKLVKMSIDLLQVYLSME
jgi:hypothetical protein